MIGRMELYLLSAKQNSLCVRLALLAVTNMRSRPTAEAALKDLCFDNNLRRKLAERIAEHGNQQFDIATIPWTTNAVVRV